MITKKFIRMSTSFVLLGTLVSCIGGGNTTPTYAPCLIQPGEAASAFQPLQTVLQVEIPTTDNQAFVCAAANPTPECDEQGDDCRLKAFATVDDVVEIKIDFLMDRELVQIEFSELFDQTCSPSPFSVPQSVPVVIGDDGDDIRSQGIIVYSPTNVGRCEATIRIRNNGLNVNSQFPLRIRGEAVED